MEICRLTRLSLSASPAFAGKRLRRSTGRRLLSLALTSACNFHPTSPGGGLSQPDCPHNQFTAFLQTPPRRHAKTWELLLWYRSQRVPLASPASSLSPSRRSRASTSPKPPRTHLAPHGSPGHPLRWGHQPGSHRHRWHCWVWGHATHAGTGHPCPTSPRGSTVQTDLGRISELAASPAPREQLPETPGTWEAVPAAPETPPHLQPTTQKALSREFFCQAMSDPTDGKDGRSEPKTTRAGLMPRRVRMDVRGKRCCAGREGDATGDGAHGDVSSVRLAASSAYLLVQIL